MIGFIVGAFFGGIVGVLQCVYVRQQDKPIG